MGIGMQEGERRSTGLFKGFPGGSDGEESACNAGDPGWISGLGRSPGEIHRQRSLVGYGTWGHIELDTTEWLVYTQGEQARVWEVHGDPAHLDGCRHELFKGCTLRLASPSPVVRSSVLWVDLDQQDLQFYFISFSTFLFIFCKLHVISRLIPWPPGCPVPGLCIKTGNPARSRSWNCFLGGLISRCAGGGSSEMSWKAALVRNEMWWALDFYWHTAWSWHEQRAQRLLNPVFLGWESDPVLSLRNDTYLLDDAA